MCCKKNTGKLICFYLFYLQVCVVILFSPPLCRCFFLFKLKMKMKLFTNSLEGVFLERPNRFIIQADTPKGIIRAHCPNPGRLLELLIPGRKIILEKSNNSSRKTEYTLVAAYYKNKIIPLYSARANKVAQNLVIPLLFPGNKKILAEQTVDSSRFDFLIITKKQSIYLEVKACTLVENEIGMFPDAPTTRGMRHVKELAVLSEKHGNRCKGHILFLIAHPDCRLFIPNIHTDPDFSLALKTAEDNISIHAVSISTTPDGETGIARLNIPVSLSPVEWIVKDTGSYILIIAIRRKKQVQTGALGLLWFRKGYYCYSGSALQHLHHRIKRHMKKNKKSHWHIDYLTKTADSVKSYVIYNTEKLECSIAGEIKSISDQEIKGFGSSDCGCMSHLHYFKDNPEKNEAFISILLKFRHFYGKL